MSNYEDEFNKDLEDTCDISMSKSFLNYLKSKEDLERAVVKINVNKLIQSNIKQIVLPLHRFIEWKCFGAKKQKLHKSEMFDACLGIRDAKRAKKLNRIYASEIWDLFDDAVKNKITFKDFVD